MREFAKSFYKSKTWQNTREAYYKKAGGLCERCLKRGDISPGEIVHHKIHLTKDNINDPNISLSFKNLELLCRKCHGEVHNLNTGKNDRFKIDANGNIIIKESLDELRK